MWRDDLWHIHKLSDMSVEGRMWDVIKNMYVN